MKLFQTILPRCGFLRSFCSSKNLSFMNSSGFIAEQQFNLPMIMQVAKYEKYSLTRSCNLPSITDKTLWDFPVIENNPKIINEHDLDNISQNLNVSIDSPDSTSNIPEIKCLNDRMIRKRKMKRHQKRKWRKKHINLLRTLEMQRQRKEEAKLNEILEWIKKRSDAWDLDYEMDQRLNLARRNGYYESPNPITSCHKGQDELQLLMTHLKELLTTLLKVVDTRTLPCVASHKILTVLPSRVSELCSLLKEAKSKLENHYDVVTAFTESNGLTEEPVVPLVNESTTWPKPDSDQLNRLAELQSERDVKLQKLASLNAELERIKSIMLRTVWTLNDLSDSTIRSL